MGDNSIPWHILYIVPRGLTFLKCFVKESIVWVTHQSLTYWVFYHNLEKFCLPWAMWFHDGISQVEVDLQIHHCFRATKVRLYNEKCWSVRLVQTWHLYADSHLRWCCFSEADWHHVSYGLNPWKKLLWAWTEREEHYSFSFSGHKDPNSAQIYTGEVLLALQGPADAALLNLKAQWKASPKASPIFWMPSETEDRAKQSGTEFLFHPLHFHY